jgi:hypothetical protein
MSGLCMQCNKCYINFETISCSVIVVIHEIDNFIIESLQRKQGSFSLVLSSDQTE